MQTAGRLIVLGVVVFQCGTGESVWQLQVNHQPLNVCLFNSGILTSLFFFQ
ncbi:Uncharacterised protein [Yersinia enterocolitica]|nr:Uncharacterised protein [Yersinia enterocolitica]